MNVLRRYSIGALAALAALPLLITAIPTPATAATSSTGQGFNPCVTPPCRTVETFLHSYLEASSEEPPNEVRIHQLRAQYITPEENLRLDQWAQQYNADPILRAQNSPESYSIQQGDSGAGHTTVIVMEHFAAETLTVRYALRLEDLKISDIEG